MREIDSGNLDIRHTLQNSSPRTIEGEKLVCLNHVFEFSSSLRRYVSGALIGASAFFSGCNTSIKEESDLHQTRSIASDTLERVPALEGLLKANSLPERESKTLERVILSEPEGSLIIDDTYEPIYFEFRGVQQAIFVSKAFKSKFPNGVVPANEDLGGFTFYVAPSLNFEQANLNDAYNKKEQVGTIHHQPQFKMTCEAILLPDELRKLASDQINERYSGSKVTKDNIAVVPYKYIALMAGNGDDKVLVAQYPTVSKGRAKIPTLVNQPLRIPIEFTGSEKELELVRDKVSFEAEFWISGFEVRQNILSLSLSAIARQGYLHYLTGQADWSKLSQHKLTSDSSSIAIPGINLGFGSSESEVKSAEFRHSLVSREQLKNLSEAVVKNVIANEWREVKEDPAQFESATDLLLTYLLGHMTAIDVKVDNNGKILIDAGVQKEIAPDVITKLESDIKANPDLYFQKDVTAPIGQAGAASGGAAKGAKADKDGGAGTVRVKDTNHYKVEQSGKVTEESQSILPKSVRVYQLNSDLIDDLTHATVARTEATARSKNFLVPGIITEVTPIEAVVKSKTLELPIHWTTIPHTGGGDADVDSGGHRTSISFKADAPTLKDGVVSINASYEVHETVDNYTALTRSETIEIPVPSDLLGVTLANDQNKPLIWSFDFNDQRHDFIGVEESLLGNTVVKSAELRADGDDDDHSGNAQAKFTLRVVIDYIESPASEKVTFQKR